jgi:25S rRNA (adenine2142-N1)-methyltransferase
MRRKRQPITLRKSIKDTQKTISEYHTLLKQKEQKQRELELNYSVEKEQELADMEQKVNAIGIDAYQKASLRSCEKGRGGCGRFLVECIQKFEFDVEKRKNKKPVLLLDVGAITGEEYLKYSFLKVTSIDLQTQSPLVIKCDFFDFPLPLTPSFPMEALPRNSDTTLHIPNPACHQDACSDTESEDVIPRPQEAFDILCLSLVLNFVPHPLKRGEMLIRAHEMLRDDGWLYIVLPLPCVSNSRYLDETHLLHMMNSIGFQLVVSKNTRKLSYFVFKKSGPYLPQKYKKTEIHAGKKRNNFCILLD